MHLQTFVISHTENLAHLKH